VVEAGDRSVEVVVGRLKVEVAARHLMVVAEVEEAVGRPSSDRSML
jgi:hypothetical protein